MRRSNRIQPSTLLKQYAGVVLGVDCVELCFRCLKEQGLPRLGVGMYLPMIGVVRYVTTNISWVIPMFLCPNLSSPSLTFIPFPNS